MIFCFSSLRKQRSRQATVQSLRFFLLICVGVFHSGALKAADVSEAEFQAVRAILDVNGLTKKSVEGVSIIEDGRIVGLYLQEGGIAKIPDEIGKLTALRLVHLYGDRSLDLPLLKEISPTIGNCTEIEELLLNQNALTTLPAEIANLKKITLLSIADNQIQSLPPAADAWAKKFDPSGLSNQTTK